MFRLWGIIVVNMKKVNQKLKVLVALSGGIDSAVSAYLLKKEGFEVEGVFMKNWSKTRGLKLAECPWLQDRQEALRVAAFLRIPLHTLDFEKQYGNKVMSYFFAEYKAGRTPNPDVMCNKEIKFKLLYDWAMAHGFDYLATGHYARVVSSEQWSVVSGDKKRVAKHLPLVPLPSVALAKLGRHWSLSRSADEFKDQTYFIYNIKKEQLERLMFPVGGMKKERVRALAKKIKLPNADRKESMGLCFVGKVRLKDFLEQKLRSKKGPIYDQEGKKIGEHQGLHVYTIGQRQGIRVGGSGPYYVVKKDLKKNTLYVTNDPEDKELETRELNIHSVNWISEPEWNSKGESFGLVARYRHQGDLVPIKISRTLNKGEYKINFRSNQKAVASGQSLVIYKGLECLGGGVIV